MIWLAFYSSLLILNWSQILFCCNTCTSRWEWCVAMVACVEEWSERFWWLRHLQWGHCLFLQRITSSDRLIEDAEHFLHKVLVSAYTVSLARETKLLSHCLKVSVESGGVQKAGFRNDWPEFLGKRYLLNWEQPNIYECRSNTWDTNTKYSHRNQHIFSNGQRDFFSYFCVLTRRLFFMDKTSTVKNMSDPQMRAVNLDCLKRRTQKYKTRLYWCCESYFWWPVAKKYSTLRNKRKSSKYIKQLWSVRYGAWKETVLRSVKGNWHRWAQLKIMYEWL